MNDPGSPEHSRKAASKDTPDTFLKRQLDTANKDKTDLQARVRHLDAQNNALLKSLFEVSSAAPGRLPRKPLPVDILSALRQLSNDPATTTSAVPPSGKGSAYRRSAPDRRPSTASNDAGVQPRVTSAYAPFRLRADLVGHASAVYAVQFSPNGTLLVSASFDRSLRFWPVARLLERARPDDRVCIRDAHHAPVTSVEWAFDSARVISGGLDQTAAEWDVEASKTEPVARFVVDGLVNAVSISPANDNLFFVGTSRRVVHLFDRRAPRWSKASSNVRGSGNSHGSAGNESVILSNDAPVNTLHVTLDGTRFITGDHAGSIKTWELRGGRGGEHVDDGHTSSNKVALLDSTVNDDTRRPITHIHTAPPLSGEQHGRFMAVNSYDSFLRVYDRGACLFREARPTLLPLQALRGVVGANWPIKSSFFLGADYRPAAGLCKRSTRRSVRRRHRGHDKVQDSRSVNSKGGKSGGRGSNESSGVSGSSGNGSSDDEEASGSGDDETDSGDGRTEGEDRGSNVGGEVGADGSSGGGSDEGGKAGRSSGGGVGIRKSGAGGNIGSGGSGVNGPGGSSVSGTGGVAGGGADVEDDFGETIGAPLHESLILASGSADGRVYVFDVAARPGSGGLLQTLGGHRDRVYAVDFHPSEPLLASCSADSDIKIWHSR